MHTSIDLFSTKNGEIIKLLKKYYGNDFNIPDDLHWKSYFDNPVNMINLIEIIIDNNDIYNITIWICLDEDVLINVNSTNANNIIKYLFERYPY